MSLHEYLDNYVLYVSDSWKELIQITTVIYNNLEGEFADEIIYLIWLMWQVGVGWKMPMIRKEGCTIG